MKLKKSHLFFLLATASSVSYLHALTWDPTNVPTAPVGGAGTWDAATTSNWSDGTVDSVWGNSPTAVATFTGTLGGAVTVGPGGVSVNGLTFSNTVTAYTFSGAPITLIGTTPTLTTAGTGNVRSITIPNATIGSSVMGTTLNIAGTGVVSLSNTAISGALTISSPSANPSGLILTGTNTAGSVAVGSNVLAIGSNTALASGTAISAGANSFVLLANGISTQANITASGGTLNLQLGNGADWKGSLTHTTANDLTVNPNATGTTISGNISMAAGGRLFFRNDQTVNPSALFNTTTSGTGIITVTGNISGTNTLNIGTTANTTTVTLSGTNTFTGAATIGNGSLTINSIKNVSGGASALGAPTTVANGTIALGSAATSGTLKYNGTGDITDRVVNLAGTTGGAILDQSGAGLLKFTSAFTATGVGSRTVTLQGSTAGTGEISGAILNNTVNPTTLSATFVASASPIQITLASVSGVVVGTSTISGTGITGNAVITAVDIPNKKVTIASTSGASGATGSAYTLGSVLNPIAVTKAGTGTWTLSGTSSYAGATAVNAGTLNVTGSLASAVTVGSVGTLTGAGGSTSGTLTLATGATIFGAPGTVSGSNGTSFTAASISSSATGIKVLGLAAADGTVDIARYTGTWTGAASDFDLSAFRVATPVTSVPAATGNKLQFTVTKLADTWTQASGTWDNTHSAGLWSNSGENAYYAGDDVLFSDLVGQPTATVTLNSVVTPNSVVFNSSTTNYTISGTGSISGSTTLTKSGSGTVTLGNANTFTGQTDLSASTLILANANALQNSTLNITGGTLAFDSSVVANAFTLGGLSGSQGIALQNNAGSPAAIALTFGNNNSSTTYSGVLSGAGSLTKNGTGSLTLSGANTYTGKTTLNGGITQISADSNLGTAPGAAIADQLSFGGGSLQFVAPVTLVANRGIRLNSATTFDTNGNAVTADGIITGTAAFTKSGAGTLMLTKANTYTGNTTISAGTLQVGNANATNNRLTTLNGGNLTISDTVTLNVDNNLVFASNTNATVSAVSGAASLQGYDINSADITVNTGITASISSSVGLKTATFGFRIDNTGDLSVAGVISGNGSDAGFNMVNQYTGTDRGALYKLGVGTLTLTGASTFTSAGVPVTSVQGGTLKLAGGNNRLPAVSGVYLGQGTNSGKLVLDGISQTITGLKNVGTGTSNAVVGASATLSTLTVNSANSYTFAGAIGGAGTNENNLALVKSGAGTLTLSGAYTYTGNTTINGGILSLGTASLADASSVSIASGATLDLTHGATDTVGSIYINGVLQPAGLYKSSTGVGPGTVIASLTGTGKLQATTGSITNYADWASSKAFTVGVNDGKADNPDNDGLNNLGEFAFDGNPLSGKNDGKIVSKVAVIDGESVLTLTLPVLSDASFIGFGPLVSNTVNGVTYIIECSDGLTAFDLPVEQVTDSTDLAAIQGTLAVDHPLTIGWSYRTFRVAPVSAASKQFIRARVTE